MGSTRLPGKTMKKIDECYVIDYVIEQLKSAKKIDMIVVATTDLIEDDIICEHLSSKCVKYFRGSSDDVLDRYYRCAKEFSIDVVVRVTADNPLIDPQIIDLVINKYITHNCDFATNTIHRTFPYGTEVEVFSFKALERSWKSAKKPSEREHVTPFIRDPENGFDLINVEHHDDLSFLRYTVDRAEDLELVREIVKHVSERPILLRDIINLYKNRPEIFDINKNVTHDGFLSSLKKDQQYLKSQKNDKNKDG
jgi:spore coat polysaccharide biosynthesis protein SpsF